METHVNYYDKLSLNPEDDLQTLQRDLQKAQRTWERRQFSSPDARGMLGLIGEALEVFGSEESRASYDTQLGIEKQRAERDPRKEEFEKLCRGAYDNAELGDFKLTETALSEIHDVYCEYCRTDGFRYLEAQLLSKIYAAESRTPTDGGDGGQRRRLSDLADRIESCYRGILIYTDSPLYLYAKGQRTRLAIEKEFPQWEQSQHYEIDEDKADWLYKRLDDLDSTAYEILDADREAKLPGDITITPDKEAGALYFLRYQAYAIFSSNSILEEISKALCADGGNVNYQMAYSDIVMPCYRRCMDPEIMELGDGIFSDNDFFNEETAFLSKSSFHQVLNLAAIDLSVSAMIEIRGVLKNWADSEPHIGPYIAKLAQAIQWESSIDIASDFRLWVRGICKYLSTPDGADLHAVDQVVQRLLDGNLDARDEATLANCLIAGFIINNVSVNFEANTSMAYKYTLRAKEAAAAGITSNKAYQRSNIVALLNLEIYALFGKLDITKYSMALSAIDKPFPGEDEAWSRNRLATVEAIRAYNVINMPDGDLRAAGRLLAESKRHGKDLTGYAAQVENLLRDLLTI